jgi:hypothetical protein
MEPQGSLLHSQEPVTCPYPEPGQSSSCPLLPFMPGFSKWSHSLRFPQQNTVWTSHLPPTYVTCPTHRILLDLITQITFGAQQQYLLNDMGWDNIVQQLTMDWMVLGSNPGEGHDFMHPSKLVLGTTQPHTIGTGSFSGVKQPGCGVNQPTST